MSGDHEYRLTIDALTPARLPMARLAEYMAEFARLLGEPDQVHFSRLEIGSVVLVSAIEEPAVPRVKARLQQVQHGLAERQAMQAYRALDSLLADDDAVATIDEGATQVIAFPGRTRPEPVRYGPFREEGSLDGTVIRIGGLDKTIPVWLQDAEGAQYVCQTDLETSKRLAQRYRAGTVRVFGSGKWVREEDGTWTLLQFDIARFEVLDDAPLPQVVSRLQEVEGAEWDGEVGDIAGLQREDGLPH